MRCEGFRQKWLPGSNWVDFTNQYAQSVIIFLLFAKLNDPEFFELSSTLERSYSYLLLVNDLLHLSRDLPMSRQSEKSSYKLWTK